jgi:hypothetical protein
MPTRILFATAGEDRALHIDVAEDAAAVANAFRQADGEPAQFTTTGKDPRPVYVNPLTVAFWTDISPRRRIFS